MLLLVPGDVLRPRRPDEHFADEVAAARDAGIEVAVIDHDALTSGGSADAAVSRVPAATDAVYRGWMLNGSQYAALEAALSRRDVTLRTSADAYRRAHELPGWCTVAGTLTPETVWTDGDDRDGFMAACASLGTGAAVLRDYTKSMKHHWHEAAYIESVSDLKNAWKIATRFRELRDDEFTGGFVLRRFEQLTGAEVRTWWLNGTCRLVTAHPDTPADLPPTSPPSTSASPTGPSPTGPSPTGPSPTGLPLTGLPLTGLPLTGLPLTGPPLTGLSPASLDPEFLAPLIRSLNLPFVTADLARHADGRWRLIEIGDGQVSDRPRSTPAADLIAALMR
ncbi:ATP-grasp domain-containing protein [Actinoplanes sp. L3-i22]|uniref:ATP-grasp domain-containing protein n=1 Tax=Actinoplanes sp. L3-i22 TaxID=2836373 RepID=UPI001C76D06B|nr:ATP-grasp domain-containing protein [Actinoplanes sp. L3-i22]BCY10238.1 hypothetical protein L3i22_053260 [Actinoplanes sp. L3-i22]